MSKYIYSMFHGNTKTKVFLWSLVLMGIGVVACIIAAILLSEPIYIGAAVFLLFLLLIVSQSYSLTSLEREGSKKGKTGKNGKTAKGKAAKKEESGKEQDGARYAAYDDKQLNKIFAKYKVREDHHTVLVDRSATHKIEQCPAYIWIAAKRLHVLLLENKPRKIEIPLSQIETIRYQQGVSSKPEEEYTAFLTPSLVTTVFKNHLPVYKEKVDDGKQSFSKNLYWVEKEFAVTNTSARNLFTILDVDFVIDNEVTKSNAYSDFFKRAYKYSILCRDLVITKQEFTEKIDALLDEMARADMTERDFTQTLRAMLRSRFISHEQVAISRHNRTFFTS